MTKIHGTSILYKHNVVVFYFQNGFLTYIFMI